MTIPLFKPSIKRKDMDAVLTCLVTDAIGPGEENKQFVKMLSTYIGMAGGIAFREPYRALKTALSALELNEKTKIIISPLSPGYYIDVLGDLGLQPVFVDIDPENCCMEPEKVEQAIDDETGAIILHYPIGFVPDVETILEFSIPVIEDISESIGSNTGNVISGSLGRYTMICTEPENLITTSGGAVLLAKNNHDLGKIRTLTANVGKEVFLPDMNAALGKIQLKRLESHISSRAEIAKVFTDAVRKSKHSVLQQKGDAEQVWYSFPVMLQSGMKNVRQYAGKKHIETEQAFKDTAFERNSEDNMNCPDAKNCILRCLLFPLYPSLGKKNIETVARVLATLP